MWMSKSSPARRTVRSYQSQPSGSSLAIDAIITSCRSGNSSFAARYTSITPSGSFHGSKREICVIIGRAGSTP